MEKYSDGKHERSGGKLFKNNFIARIEKSDPFGTKLKVQASIAIV